MVAAEPENESSYPLITANVLDSEGKVLFRLVRNVLEVNPGHCSKIIGDLVGYEVHDSTGVRILRIETRFRDENDGPPLGWITTIEGAFYNKHGEIVLDAKSGGPDEKLVAGTKSAFGVTGASIGFVSGYSDTETRVVASAIHSRGRIHRLLTGLHEGGEIVLDGHVIMDATLRDCGLIIRSGDFVWTESSKAENCRLDIRDAAANVLGFLQSAHQGPREAEGG